MFGLLLGDGSYDKNGRFQIVHSNSKRDYIQWLDRICARWGVTYSARYDKRYFSQGKMRDYSYIRMKFHKKARVENYSRFFIDGKKIVSKYAATRLTPLSWLFLWLDQGCLSVHCDGRQSVTRRAVFHTCGFDEASNNHLIASLASYGITAKLKMRNREKYFMLTVSANHFKTFIDMVRVYLKYVPVSLLYKFDMKYEGRYDGTLLKYNLQTYLQARGSASHPTRGEDMVCSTR